jgi:hypothetical protein
VVSPCITLTVAGQQSGAVSESQPAPNRAPAAGAPTRDLDAAGVPFQTITVPAGLPHGTILTLTATVPDGVPGAGNPVLVARLTLTVD